LITTTTGGKNQRIQRHERTLARTGWRELYIFILHGSNLIFIYYIFFID